MSVCAPFLACSGNEALAGPPVTPSGALQTSSAPTQHCPTTWAQEARHQQAAPSTASSGESGRVFPPSQPTGPSVPCGRVLPAVPGAASLARPTRDQVLRPPSSRNSVSLDNDDFDDIDFGDFDDFDIPDEAFLDSTAQPAPSLQSPPSCPPPVGGAPVAETASSLPSPAIITKDRSPCVSKPRPVCKVEPLQSTPPQTIVLDDSPPPARKHSPLDAKKGGALQSGSGGVCAEVTCCLFQLTLQVLLVATLLQPQTCCPS